MPTGDYSRSANFQARALRDQQLLLLLLGTLALRALRHYVKKSNYHWRNHVERRGEYEAGGVPLGLLGISATHVRPSVEATLAWPLKTNPAATLEYQVVTPGNATCSRIINYPS